MLRFENTDLRLVYLTLICTALSPAPLRLLQCSGRVGLDCIRCCFLGRDPVSKQWNWFAVSSEAQTGSHKEGEPRGQWAIGALLDIEPECYLLSIHQETWNAGDRGGRGLLFNTMAILTWLLTAAKTDVAQRIANSHCKETVGSLCLIGCLILKCFHTRVLLWSHLRTKMPLSNLLSMTGFRVTFSFFQKSKSLSKEEVLLLQCDG